MAFRWSANQTAPSPAATAIDGAESEYEVRRGSW